MSKVYKYRLLKDLPEYPKDCVFVLDDKGWRGYWDGGDWTIPKWLEELLYSVMPEVTDEMLDWFVPIIDSEQVLYDVTIRGEIKERTVYDFWGGWESSNTFTDRKVAENKAAQIRQIFSGVDTPVTTATSTSSKPATITKRTLKGRTGDT